jgi:hypothetical protein
MFTQKQMHNDMALVSGATLKQIILDRLPHKIFKQMHTVDFTRQTDDEIITIFTHTGRTAENWDEAKRKLGQRKSILEVRKDVQK